MFYKIRINRRYVLMAIVFLLLYVYVSYPRARYLEFEYIIPDNYTGYLAIRFDCPEGTRLNIQNNVVRIEFESDGTYCTSDSFFPSWTTGNRAWSASGTPIPIFFRPQHGSGYAICCGSTRVSARSYGEFTFILYWVGNMAIAHLAWPGEPGNFDAFLEDRFAPRNDP